MRACVRACARACVRLYVCAFVCACMLLLRFCVLSLIFPTASMKQPPIQTENDELKRRLSAVVEVHAKDEKVSVACDPEPVLHSLSESKNREGLPEYSIMSANASFVTSVSVCDV